MTLPNVTFEKFSETIKTYLTPARAISSPEFLHGRSNLLNRIERAFNSEGKHVMIFGDRGVGKTSLARTAAFLQHKGSGEPPVLICEPKAEPMQLLNDIAKRCLPGKANLQSQITKHKANFGGSIFGYSLETEIQKGKVPQISSMNEAYAVLMHLASLHERPPVILIDELDVIESLETKKFLASFLHNISDQEIPLRFIVCGIGMSLTDLISQHPSVGRHIAPFELERLSHDARWEIIQAPAKELGVKIDRETLIRIGQISDGFPYYIHLLGEQLFWAIFDDNKDVDLSNSSHFSKALFGAMEEAEPVLKMSYELATEKYKQDYKEVLWAVVDAPQLRRQVSEIYDTSYRRIASESIRKLAPDQDQESRAPLEKIAFNNRLNSLKTERHGNILRGTGAGWFEFRENRLRGYVRLRAERDGIQLAGEHYLSGTRPII